MNKNLFLYIKGVGILIGFIAILTLVSRYPINVGFVVFGAAIYFISDYLKKHM